MIALSFTCSGWNEGTMAGTCALSVLEPIYNALLACALLLAFGGVIFYGPLVLLFYAISSYYKVRGWTSGNAAPHMHNRWGLVVWGITTLTILWFVYVLAAG
jgi:hypothetical protein